MARVPWFLAGFLLAACFASPVQAADDPLDKLAGPASSRFT